MKEVTLIISKKTLVPTRRQNVHKWRSDWKHVRSLLKPVTAQMFKSINREGGMETDAEFAFWVFHNCGGAGTYSILKRAKGSSAFARFMMIEVDDYGFKRTKSQVSEARRLKSKYNRLKKELKSDNPKKDKEQLREEIDEIKVELGGENEINKLLSQDETGCRGWLATTKPIYRYHSYGPISELGKERQQNRRGIF